MATIKQLVGTERAETLYALKDRIKAQGMLDQDPMRLNRTQFELYLSAKAEALVLDLTSEGQDVDAAFQEAAMHLTILDSRWRVAAKELNEMVYHTAKGEVHA